MCALGIHLIKESKWVSSLGLKNLTFQKFAVISMIVQFFLATPSKMFFQARKGIKVSWKKARLKKVCLRIVVSEILYKDIFGIPNNEE